MLSFLYSPDFTRIHDSWKTIALIRQTFVGKVMSQLFNTLSRLVIAFLSMTKHFLISWVQLPSAVTLEPKKIVSHHFHCFPIYLPLSDGTLKLEQCHVSQAQGTWLSSKGIVAEGFADSGVVAPLLIPNLVSCLLVGRHYCK